jgi:hypothetical protein
MTIELNKAHKYFGHAAYEVTLYNEAGHKYTFAFPGVNQFALGVAGVLIEYEATNPDGFSKYRNDYKERWSENKTNLPFDVGSSWLIRTVTFAVTGRVKQVKGKFIVLEDAAWVADTGRFSDAVESGTLSEVEAVTVDVVVNTDSIVDAYIWKHRLPKETI